MSILNNLSNKLNFDKMNGLIPAVIIDDKKGTVLMLGFMNCEALNKTFETGKVTFFSRTHKKIWTKGETSGNYLNVVEIKTDCDNDTLLIKVNPSGNICHTGDFSCFKEKKYQGLTFLTELFELIVQRKKVMPLGSYTTKLFSEGENRIIQKVGEEAVETIIAAKNHNREELINETSDLIYHMFVMLVQQGISINEVAENLCKRHST